MTLPSPPLLTGNDTKNIELIHSYLYDLLEGFANAAGEAIDPANGQGGDSALTVTEVPVVSYIPGSELSVDGVIFGHVDVAYSLPDRAVDLAIFYKEENDTNYKISYASSSPFRIVSLRVGTVYEVKAAGQAANGSLGPFSATTEVNIPTTSLETTAPTNLQAVGTFRQVVVTWVAPVDGVLLEYEIEIADDEDFTVNVEIYPVDVTYFIYDAGAINITKHFRVRSIDRASTGTAFTVGVSATTVNVESNSITYIQLQDISAASRILGRRSTSAGNPEELTVANALEIVGTELRNKQSTGWSTSGVTPDKSLTVGDTLAQTQDFLGTLVDELLAQGYLTA